MLESVPDINLLDYLPEILDGLFQILGDNGKEIRMGERWNRRLGLADANYYI